MLPVYVLLVNQKEPVRDNEDLKMDNTSCHVDGVLTWMIESSGSTLDVGIVWTGLSDVGGGLSKAVRFLGRTITWLSVTNHVDVVSVTFASFPPSPRLSRKLSDLHGDQAATDYTVDRQTDNAQAHLPGLAASDDGNRVAQSNVADVLSPPVMFKHPTHLITPSEIMAMSSSESTRISEDRSEGVSKIQDLVVNSEMGNVELEVKVVGQAGFSHDSGSVPQVDLSWRIQCLIGDFLFSA
ncbi:hypothetical protein Ancab_008496 [Ancistrocladus abbreviatus]